MSRQKLEESLRALADELEGLDDLDDDAADDIRKAIDEIREALDGDDSGPLDAMRERLSEVAEDFEESHPSLAGALASLADLLSRAGV